jgi:hypothetical protein
LVRLEGRVIVNLFDARLEACIGGSADKSFRAARPFGSCPPEIRHSQTLL